MKQGSWAVYAVLGVCTLVSAFHFAPVRQDAGPRMPLRAGTEDVRPQRDVDAEVDAQVQWLHDAQHRRESIAISEDPSVPKAGVFESKQRPAREI